ncbi:hypothetical protein FVER53590_25664 [Fusarium verticillioides]|nr:hypothetical protein FVER53590_25664 [Fusarium verticillioides]
MEATGMALSVYKDVYLLVMSIYRLGMSASHYREEHEWLLTKFHGEYLYLRVFIHVFAALEKTERTDQSMHVVAHIHSIVEHLGKELSDYKDVARMEDEKYRDQCEVFSRAQRISPAELENILMEPMTPPRTPPKHSTSSNPRKRGNPLSGLGTLKGVLPKMEPIFKADAWAWALFGRRKLEAAVETFCDHNARLQHFEFVIFSTITSNLRKELGASTERDQLLLQKRPASDELEPIQSGFATHARLNALVESANGTEGPTAYADHTIPTGGVEAAKRPISLTAWEVVSDGPTMKEYKRYSSVQTQQTSMNIEAINQLAHLLRESGANGFHTLPLKSVTNDPDRSWFTFEFSYPAGVSDKEAVNLNELIEDGQGPDAPSLTLRFHTALSISLAIGAFHADGWLHKSMRSESIRFFYDQDDRCIYKNPYLVNFEYSRPEMADTIFASDPDVGRNLYRHPDRQGLPTVKFNKAHDLYSLGVVLLEIGVWQTAASMREDYLDEYNLKASGKVTSEIKNLFLKNAEDRLAHTMGSAYKQAVIACISGEFEPLSDRNDFALQFQEKVIKNIEAERVREIDIL